MQITSTSSDKLSSHIPTRSKIFLISVMLFMSCSTTPKTENKVSSEKIPTYQCYGSFTDKDSVFLQLAYEGDNVRGDLVYKLFEKDKNIGSLEGRLHGDTIFAVYKFLSEGITSEREVAFLRQDSNLLEGFAPLDDGGTHFKNKKELDFTGIVLMPDRCK